MNLYGVLEKATYTVDRHSHQQNQKNTDRSFSNCLLDVAQSTGEALKRGIDFVRRHPAQAFVSAVSLLPLSAARALPAAAHPGYASASADACREMDRAYYKDPSTAHIAKAYDDCITLHGGPREHFEYRQFHFAQAEVRCLGESIRNLCGKRDLGSPSNWEPGNAGVNHDAVHTEGHPRWTRQDTCTRLAGRAAGIETDIKYAHADVDALFEDVVRIYQKSDDYVNHVKLSAMYIIEKHGLASDMDGTMDESDFWAWVRSREDALTRDLDVPMEFKSPTDNRLISLLRGVADELYTQTDLVRNSAVYQRLVNKIEWGDGIDHMIYPEFFRAVVEQIIDELGIRSSRPEPAQAAHPDSQEDIHHLVDDDPW